MDRLPKQCSLIHLHSNHPTKTVRFHHPDPGGVTFVSHSRPVRRRMMTTMTPGGCEQRPLRPPPDAATPLVASCARPQLSVANTKTTSDDL
eukprot:1194946-Prorocentrum_minimum.AAC.5